MRISTKGRYGLSAMICLALKTDGTQRVVDVADKLSVSKIYLEHVFALLKNAGLIKSTKGAQGGYSLAFLPSAITVCSVLRATEAGLFDATEKSISGKAEYLETVLQDHVWKPLDKTVEESLSKITLADLVEKAVSTSSDVMFYI